MNKVEVLFPILGSQMPTDHAYSLYSAVCHWITPLHAQNSRVQIGPVLGQFIGKGLMQLEPRRSRLQLRLPAEDIPNVLPLAGKSLNISGYDIRLGVPQVRSLIPAPNLVAHMVTIKRSDRQDRAGTRAYMEPGSFLEGVARELTRRGIQGEAGIPLLRQGPRAGQPCRRVLRIKEKRLIGFALQVTGLTAEESINLQEDGLGGKQKMGCGYFIPLKPSRI